MYGLNKSRHVKSRERGKKKKWRGLAILVDNNIVYIDHNCNLCVVVNKFKTYWFQLDLELTVVEHLSFGVHVENLQFSYKVNLKCTCATTCWKKKRSLFSCRGKSTVKLSVRLLKLP